MKTTTAKLLALAASAIGLNTGPIPIWTQTSGSNGLQMDSRAERLNAAIGGGGRGTHTGPRSRGPGWTNKHAQRVAAKARNVKRHRKTMKG